MFTATIIMQLVAAGKLDLNSKLDPYFPEIPHAKQITIGQLLKHHSGLTDQKFQVWQQNGKGFSLTKKAEYANVNYGLLSEIAQRVTKTSFASLLQSGIIEPCQLKNTFYGPPPDSIHDEAKSYYYSSKWNLVEPGDLSSAAGAGAIISTPTDLNSFLFQLFSEKLTPPDALSEMKRIADGYGSGMMQVYWGEKMAFSHAGQINGFQSRVVFFPEDNFSVSYCFNGVATSLDNIFEVLRICFRG